MSALEFSSRSVRAFVGRRGQRPEQAVAPGTNSPTNIYGRDYTGHAIDRIQGRGLTPIVVENTIKTGVASAGKGNTTVHFDSINKVTAVTDTISGRVVTTYPGQPNPSRLAKIIQ